MYNRIFVINLRRALKEQKVSLRRFCQLSGVSPSFLFDVLGGRSSPTLNTMETIATTLGLPLEVLLSRIIIDPEELGGANNPKSLPSIPDGYERVFATLPAHQAFIVRKWAKRSAQKLLAPEGPKQDSRNDPVSN
ncbi:helix-turn-helix domain-containing protein [Lautropia mirabilis]